MFFALIEPAYKDLPKIPPTPYETKIEKMIGKNKFTLDVVSSIITAKE